MCVCVCCLAGGLNSINIGIQHEISKNQNDVHFHLLKGDMNQILFWLAVVVGYACSTKGLKFLWQVD